MGLLGIIPGMPNLVFILLALTLLGGAYLVDQRHKKEQQQILEQSAQVPQQQLAAQETKELG